MYLLILMKLIFFLIIFIILLFIYPIYQNSKLSEPFMGELISKEESEKDDSNRECKITCTSPNGTNDYFGPTSSGSMPIEPLSSSTGEEYSMCKRIGYTDRGTEYKQQKNVYWFDAEAECLKDHKCQSFTFEGNDSKGNVKYFSSSIPLQVPPGMWKQMNYSNLYSKSEQPCVVSGESVQPNTKFNQDYINDFVSGQNHFFDNYYTQRIRQEIKDPEGSADISALLGGGSSINNKFNDGKWHSFEGWISQITSDGNYLYGVGSDRNVWYISLNGDGGWHKLSGSCCVSDICIADNFLYGIGMGRYLWRRSTNANSRWEKISTAEHTGSGRIAAPLNQYNSRIYGRADHHNEIWSISVNGGDFEKLANSCCVIYFVIYNNMFYGIGTDHQIYQRSIDSRWHKISNGGWVSQIAVDGNWIYGIGSNDNVYKMPINGGNWLLVSNSCCVKYIIVVNGYFYGIGTNNQVYIKKIMENESPTDNTAPLSPKPIYPTCKPYHHSVWAFCGDKPKKKWGIGPEGKQKAIGNCNYASSHPKGGHHFGQCN